MQLASLTFKDEKKKDSSYSSGKSKNFVIPSSYFSEKIKPTKKVQKSNEISEPKQDYYENNEEQTPKEKSKDRVIDQPKILAERNAKKISALSLKSILKKQQLKKELIANNPKVQDLPVNEFSEKEMLVVWDKYAKKIEKDGKIK